MKKVKIILLIILILVILTPIGVEVIISVFQSVYEKEREALFELTCTAVNENTDYYVDYSNKFSTEFDSHDLTALNKRQYIGINRYDLDDVFEDKKDYPDKSLAGHAYIYDESVNNEKFIYVEFIYPGSASYFDFRFWVGLSGCCGNYETTYSVICIPDEYLKPTILTYILGDDYETLYRKDNLFVLGRFHN